MKALTKQQKRAVLITVVPLLLQSCASLPPSASGSATVTPPAKESATATPTTSAAKAPTIDGNYYLDDGPPTEDKTAYATTPDAVVRAEKILARHNQPYVVLGKRYVPFTQLQPYHRRGIASWYGKRYHGRKTASGEPYNMHAMTAAHPILPIPSYVRVTRIATGENVVVRINDRGPFLQGREIDLSYAAATRLDIVNAGTGEVMVELLIPEQTPTAAGDVGGRVETVEALSPDVYVQLAAYQSVSAAEQFLQKLQQQLPSALAQRLAVYEKTPGLYALQVGPYKDHAAAVQIDEQLCQQHGHCGFLTKRY